MTWFFYQSIQSCHSFINPYNHTIISFFYQYMILWIDKRLIWLYGLTWLYGLIKDLYVNFMIKVLCLFIIIILRFYYFFITANLVNSFFPFKNLLKEPYKWTFTSLGHNNCFLFHNHVILLSIHTIMSFFYQSIQSCHSFINPYNHTIISFFYQSIQSCHYCMDW
jgi:hypothetical protein